MNAIKIVIQVALVVGTISTGEGIMASDPFYEDSSDSAREEELLSPGSVFRIKQDELDAVIREANSGDADSSFRLHHHYRFYEKSQEEAYRWLLMAARQGHVISQYNLAVTFYKKNELDEALHWALLARKNGDDKAEKLIEKINAKARP